MALGQVSVHNTVWYHDWEMEKSVDKGKTFASLFINLSKAFDCLLHELINAKLNAYEFSLSAERLMQSYLSNKKQRTKGNTAYSL